jgi:hypothetical protein
MGNSLLDELLDAAMAHRSGKRFARSMGLIKQYIAKRPTPPLAPVALVILHQIAADSARAARNSTVLSSFAEYADSLLSVTTSDILKRALFNVKRNQRVQGRNWVEAIAVAETISARYPNSTLEEHALYTAFSANLFGLHDRPAAQQALNRMKQRFPESHLTILADLLISNTALPNGGNGLSAPKLAGANVKQSVAVPAQYALYQNYPNPFNPATAINYDLPADVHVRLKVYDVLGREVATLVDGFMQAGYHQATLDASNLASGLYFYRFNAGSYTNTKKLVVLR